MAALLLYQLQNHPEVAAGGDRACQTHEHSLSDRPLTISRVGALMHALPGRWRAHASATRNIVNALASLPVRSGQEYVYVRLDCEQ